MQYIASVSGGKDSITAFEGVIERKMPLNEVVFFDGGMEFKALYNEIEKIKMICKNRNILFTRLEPEMSFEYMMFEKPVCKQGTKAVHKYGYGWCGGVCRWGTTYKIAAIDKYCVDKYGKDGFMQYVGIAFDEKHRLEKNNKPYKLYPLVDWEMTEQQCLDYCYEKGYEWDEDMDEKFGCPSGNVVGLYDILDRVSCWCCRNKNLKELKNIYIYFRFSYWEQLKAMQSRLPQPMKPSGSVFELEERFRKETKEEAIKMGLLPKIWN